MLQTVITILVSVVLTSGNSNPSIEYPHECKHDDFTVLCEGGKIPKLEQKITTFQLKNANPSIPELSHSITRLLDHLVSLQFYSAGLTTLQPGALGLIPYLEDLHIENNDIKVINKDTFASCSKLQILFLENNNIKVIQEGAFATLHGLQNLSLSHNSLHSLPSTIPRHLRHLSVHHNLLQEIPHLSLHNLTFLSLCHNSIKSIEPQQIDAKSMKELCLGGLSFKLTNNLITQENFPVLESLALRGTSQNTMDIDDTITRNIQIMSVASLREVEFHFCSFGSTKIFSGMSSLHTLRTTNVTMFEVRTVRRQFKLPSIIVLDISGSSSLALTLLNSPSSLFAGVKVLHMSGCSITTFSKSMQERIVPNITRLDLSHNPLTCNCELSWIPDHVRDGKLTLENEEYTICANPSHLSNIPLLTATLCPNVNVLPTTTVQDLTLNTLSSAGTTVKTPNLINASVLTPTPTGGDSGTNASHPDPSSNRAKGLPKEHLILAILGTVAVCILATYFLMILGRKIHRHCKKRSFNVYSVIYT
ncbi:vasorin-like [Eriocheir sinensis]|uniref:vasorin-like n=1 Tax=Eriocheir sinensis TaxID=95602 RepID=UPI0021C814C4|nr:vasorin-like [Eriocheir sinensis]